MDHFYDYQLFTGFMHLSIVKICKTNLVNFEML